jgi:transposase
MILLTHETRIQLGVQPADFRRGIDGFVALCKNELHQNPRDQSVFVFINRAKTMIRALSYDGTGYWLLTKRISRGKFVGWPDGQCALSLTSARKLRIILSGDSGSDTQNTTGNVAASLMHLASVPASTTITDNTP